MAVLPKKLSDSHTDVELVHLSKGSMKNEHRKIILDAAMKTKDMNNEHFLLTVQSRLARCLPLQPPLHRLTGHTAPSRPPGGLASHECCLSCLSKLNQPWRSQSFLSTCQSCRLPAPLRRQDQDMSGGCAAARQGGMMVS